MLKHAGGLAPHALQHVGGLAWVAMLTGPGGAIPFGLVGLAGSTPMRLRLKRRFRTWRAPAGALALFVAMFSLSSFVIGPAIADDGSGVGDTPAGHEQHHEP